MGRVKIKIEKIEDAQKRMVTFSKRRPTLASKLSTLCQKADVENAALILFSPAGKVFSYSYGSSSSSSSSSVDDTIERFLIDNQEQGFIKKEKKERKKFVEADSGEVLDTVGKLMAEKEKKEQKKFFEADSGEELDTVDKLMAEKDYLLGLKQRMLDRLEELKISQKKNDEEEDQVMVKPITEDERIVAETLSSLSSMNGIDLDNVKKMENDD